VIHVSGLSAGTYYFAVTAYDTGGDSQAISISGLSGEWIDYVFATSLLFCKKTHATAFLRKSSGNAAFLLPLSGRKEFRTAEAQLSPRNSLFLVRHSAVQNHFCSIPEIHCLFSGIQVTGFCSRVSP
jgi:hypothetical protein